MWALGGALYHRSLSTGSVEDLDRSIHLHETVLKSWQPDHPKRSQALRFLARTCYMKWRTQEDDPSRARFVLAAETALVESPNFPERTSLLECLNAIRTAEELIKGATDLHNFIMKSGALEIIDRLTEQQEAVEKYKIEAQAFESTSSAPDPVESQIYKGLEKGQKSIRILELLPGLPGQKVFCQMFTVLLSKNTKYEVSPKTSSIPRTRQNLTFSKALSYAWGDPRETFEIVVNGHALEVRKNLYLALHRLRKQDCSRPLWVDAVCINQKDLHEKSEQVAIMRDIYEAASEVLVWLGEPQVDSDNDLEGSHNQTVNHSRPVIQWGSETDIDVMRAFFMDHTSFDDWPVVGALSALALFSRNSHLNSLPFFKDPRYVNFDLGVYPSELWQESSYALLNLLKSSYWSRVWIVQEVVLARQAHVHYGRHIIPLSVFFDAERHLQQHSLPRLLLHTLCSEIRKPPVRLVRHPSCLTPRP
jgi:hypothetical protein